MGLAGYYRKFVRDFGMIAHPLTELLKKDNFKWSPAVDFAFSALKQALASTPVLALPDFTVPFTIECDASDMGIGAVLSQNQHPIAFLSKSLAEKHKTLSVYDKEMMAIVFAVQKWRHYLLEHPFKILTDHQTLKYFINQRIITPTQQKWLLKLLGYNYTLEYRSGSLNIAADALSRQHECLAFMGLSQPLFDSISDIQAEYAQNSEALAIIHALQNSQPTRAHFSPRGDLLYYRNGIFMVASSPWRHRILQEFHSSPTAGHSRFLRTYKRVRRNFNWLGLKKTVKSFVFDCDTCQRTNYEAIKPPGLLQPLPIPSQIWIDIAMDFIEGLPAAHGRNAILVVVDRLSKYAHFIVIKHPYSAAKVADLFLHEVFRLHDIPATIVSDRDPIFMSHFWESFFKLHGSQLCRSSAYHPQSDGQTEVLNRTLEHYLCSFVGDKPSSWVDWLPWAEW